MWLLLSRWAPACRSKDFTLWTEAREVGRWAKVGEQACASPLLLCVFGLQLPLSGAGAAQSEDIGGDEFHQRETDAFPYYGFRAS